MAPLMSGTLLLLVGGVNSAPPRGLSLQQESLTYVAAQGSKMVEVEAARSFKALGQKWHNVIFMWSSLIRVSHKSSPVVKGEEVHSTSDERSNVYI